MDPLDDRVDGDRGRAVAGLDHRSVIAASDPDLGPGRRQPLGDRRNQVELAARHVLQSKADSQSTPRMIGAQTKKR